MNPYIVLFIRCVVGASGLEHGPGVSTTFVLHLNDDNAMWVTRASTSVLYSRFFRLRFHLPRGGDPPV